MRKSVLTNLATAPPSVVHRVDLLLAEIYDKITTRNQQESPLLRLPRELRDEIIKTALPLSHEAWRLYTYFPVQKALPALLSVCRRLRLETALVSFPNIAIALRDTH